MDTGFTNTTDDVHEKRDDGTKDNSCNSSKDCSSTVATPDTYNLNMPGCASEYFNEIIYDCLSVDRSKVGTGGTQLNEDINHVLGPSTATTPKTYNFNRPGVVRQDPDKMTHDRQDVDGSTDGSDLDEESQDVDRSKDGTEGTLVDEETDDLFLQLETMLTPARTTSF